MLDTSLESPSPAATTTTNNNNNNDMYPTQTTTSLDACAVVMMMMMMTIMMCFTYINARFNAIYMKNRSYFLGGTHHNRRH